MGVYSEVGIVLNDKAMRLMPPHVLKYLEKAASYDTKGDDYRMFLIGMIEWDLNVPEIKDIHDFINSLEAEKGEYYEFQRISWNGIEMDNKWTAKVARICCLELVKEDEDACEE